MTATCALLLRLDELFGLREEHSNDPDSERRTSADPEEDLIRIGCSTFRGEGKGEGGCEEVAERVTLLKDTGEETTSFDGNGLETHCDCITPYSAHAY